MTNPLPPPALFSEMMKGKAWTPATLKAVGGTKGVGITFLEETFSASTSPPEHRYHQKAARAVLKDLLPDSGTDIKGTMRSYAELLEASGYGSRPRDFDDLVRILDSEIRLITPTDPEGKDSDNDSVTQTQAGQKYFQLTHDYLVHSLRDWLTRKQKETRKGRAELRLFDLSATWNSKPENRFLPSWWENLSIRLLTDKKKWTEPQRKMMGMSGRVHGIRSALVAVLLVGVTIAGVSVRNAIVEQQLRTQAELQEKENVTRAEGLVASLLSADTPQVPAIVSDLKAYRAWADPLLKEEYDKPAATSRQKLHTSLALLPVDTTQVDYLYGRLLAAEPHEVPVIRDALLPHKDQLGVKLWKVIETPQTVNEPKRLRAAAALAKYDPANKKWENVQTAVGHDLVNVPAVYLYLWMDSLRPVRTKLLPQLEAVYRDLKRRDVERSLATDILADYAADNPQQLAHLLMDANPEQFAVIYPQFKAQGGTGLPVLIGEIDKHLPAEMALSDVKREELAKRQANAAVALLKINRPEKVWPLLQHSPDPRVRSYLIHRLSPLGADAKMIIQHLDEEPDITIRRALLLTLGDFSEAALPASTRITLLPKFREMYRTDADPGLHASVEWLLRKWQQEAWLKQVNEEWAKDKEQRGKQLNGITQLVAKDKDQTPPQWYVNGQGQTFVVIPGPAEFVAGSPLTEVNRQNDETQHKKRIGRTFAIASKSVTNEQYEQFDKDYQVSSVYRRMPEMPVVSINWYMAAKYCNWLSEQENIDEEQRIYEIKGDEITLKLNYLSLSGYRLPTEAEMEYATRAGASTSRYYGESDDLLSEYEWYNRNSEEKPWPVGLKKPNDWGLFDVQGNVWIWCQEGYAAYPATKDSKVIEDKEGDTVIFGTAMRVLRGGSFFSQVSDVRSAYRLGNVPTLRTRGFGFRPSRTLPLVPLTPLPPSPEGESK